MESVMRLARQTAPITQAMTMQMALLVEKCVNAAPSADDMIALRKEFVRQCLQELPSDCDLCNVQPWLDTLTPWRVVTGDEWYDQALSHWVSQLASRSSFCANNMLCTDHGIQAVAGPAICQAKCIRYCDGRCR